MCRRVLILVLAGFFVFQGSAFAGSVRDGRQPQGRGGAGKRVAWILAGAGAGFGAGLLFGLNRFDDAIDSDRKVWTSALVGAAAGGLAGALIGKAASGSPAPSFRSRTPADRDVDALVPKPVLGRGSRVRAVI